MLSSFKPQTAASGFTSWISGFVSQSAAGKTVTPLRAMQHTAVYACNRVLSESIASLPLVLMKKTGDKREKAVSHPLYHVLHTTPNTEHTSMEFRESIVTNLNLRGNHYSHIVRNGAGKIMELWPLQSDKVEIKRLETSGKLVYLYRLDNSRQYPLSHDEVLHIRGLSLDGIVGVSPITYNRESIGLSMATEEFGSRFFSNGANPGGVLEVPGTLTDTAYDRLRDSFDEKYRGTEKSHKTVLLEEGTKFNAVTINNNDSQFLETRKYQKSEIASIFRVPNHMINDLEKSSFSNIEQMSLEFVIYSLTPWLVRIEQAMQRDLLSSQEISEGYYIKHNLEGLLRGDSAARAELFKTYIQNSVYSPNEVRDMEDMNPYEGGDAYFVQMNMTTPEQIKLGKNLKQGGNDK